LQPGTTYYVRAYATNGAGTGYGQQFTFISLAQGQFTDFEGNVYDTVAIGTQVWMKQNLKVSKYRNGDLISNFWSLYTGAYATYNNTAANDSIYGKLYNWYAVADPRGLCPTGWHVPSNAEWSTLENFLGGRLVAGGEMKAVSSLWIPPNTGATNSSGFTGLPGGYRTNSGAFLLLGYNAYFWSSTEAATNLGWYRGGMVYNSVANSQSTNHKWDGFSVRCVRD
jgi:uncharacterized protein (TIGR02145 family)